MGNRLRSLPLAIGLVFLAAGAASINGRAEQARPLLAPLGARSGHVGAELAPPNAVRRALLVGIDKYIPPRASTSAGKPPVSGRAPAAWTDLEGAVNDVQAMREVLISRFGFDDADVHVLVNAGATRDRILSEIRHDLIEPAAPGDVSFFFYAGHGSQVRNSKSAEADKMDESIVPADANRGQPDLRDKEVARIFDEALDKRVLLTMAFDSCHSGSIARGISRPTRYRMLPPDPRDVADPSAPKPPEERGALVLSAAQDDQLAGETRDEDKTPHGLFSWAFLKTLRTMPVDETAERMFVRVRALMQSEDAAQEPVLAATPERRRASMFGAQRSGSGATVVAVQSIESDGSVVLQGGLAAGIRVNCELQEAGAAPDRAAMLRVTQERGLTHSAAIVTKGSAHDITRGALFEVVKWTAPAGPGLRVWIEPGVMSSAVAAQFRLGPGTNRDAVEVLPSAEGADYVLTGRREASGLEVAWARPFAADDTKALALPARTDWIPVALDNPAAAARQLEQLAGRLAVIRTWLQLDSPADVGQFPYRLALRNAASGEKWTKGPLHEGEQYGLVLTLVPGASALDRRYVYVFAIDTHGESALLFPAQSAGNVENRLPVRRDDDGRLPAEIALGRPDLVSVSPPLGVETVVMLTTATALSDAAILEGAAVLTRDVRAADPLSRLLTAAASGTRGQPVATPTTWSIERLTVESVPAERR